MLPCTLPSDSKCKGVTHIKVGGAAIDLPDPREKRQQDTQYNTYQMTLSTKWTQTEVSVFHCTRHNLARREEKAAWSGVRA